MDKTDIHQCCDEYKIIEMSDGVVIQKNDMLHTLNATAFEIFKLCDGVRSTANIISEMKSQYPDEDIDTKIEKFIEQLKDAGLINIMKQ